MVLRKIYQSVLVGVLVCIFGSSIQASVIGTLEKTYDFAASRIISHPALPYIYASVPSLNSIAVINSSTLNLEATVFIGSNPTGMAITHDGSRLYVANSNSNFIGVFDTMTRTALDSILVSDAPRDIEIGAGGKLYVLGSSSIQQINPATGASVGPNVGTSVYGGELATNSALNRLYYADYGLSPASLYQFDVTQSNAVKLWESPHGGLSGSNGQDLALSHDGSFVSYACGAGQGGYCIAKYRTSDMAILGTFDCGAYPREITFSPDDLVAYSVHTSGMIDLWDTRTFLSQGKIATQGEANELLTDTTGQHLFASFGSSNVTRVYATGRVVPEPGSLSLFAIALGMVAIALRLRKRFY
jgi:YVTN family beta-propeller protein